MGGSFGVGATFREIEKHGIVFMKRSWQHWIFFFFFFFGDWITPLMWEMA